MGGSTTVGWAVSIELAIMAMLGVRLSGATEVVAAKVGVMSILQTAVAQYK